VPQNEDGEEAKRMSDKVVVNGDTLFVMYHSACNNPAFYTRRMLIPDFDVIDSSVVVLLDGTLPIDCFTVMACGSCGLPIGTSMDDISYMRDEGS